MCGFTLLLSLSGLEMHAQQKGDDSANGTKQEYSQFRQQKLTQRLTESWTNALSRKLAMEWNERLTQKLSKQIETRLTGQLAAKWDTIITRETLY